MNHRYMSFLTPDTDHQLTLDQSTEGSVIKNIWNEPNIQQEMESLPRDSNTMSTDTATCSEVHDREPQLMFPTIDFTQTDFFSFI